MHELNVDVVCTIDQIDPAGWNTLCHGRSFVDHRWLRLAQAILVDHAPRYVLLRRQGRLEAAAICTIGRRFGNRSLQRRLGWVLRPFGWVRCSVPLSSEPGIVLAPGADSGQLVPALLSAVRPEKDPTSRRGRGHKGSVWGWVAFLLARFATMARGR